MAAPERIYWDSMMFNHRIAGNHADIALLKDITDRAEKGDIEIATSTFTFCEVAKIQPDPTNPKALSNADQEKMIVEFFQNDFIIPVQLDRRISIITRDIVRSFASVKAKDAIHIASAIIANV